MSEKIAIKRPEPEERPSIRDSRPPEPDSVPQVDSKKAGHVGQILEGLALAYKEKHPGREIRWVYAPLHRGELSNVMTKRAQGYRPVYVKEIGNLDGFSPDDQVRVSDLVLMSVDEEIQQKLEAEVKERADDQLRQVEQEYYENISSLDARDGADPRMRPAGRAVIEERDHDYEVKQR